MFTLLARRCAASPLWRNISFPPITVVPRASQSLPSSNSAYAGNDRYSSLLQDMTARATKTMEDSYARPDDQVWQELSRNLQLSDLTPGPYDGRSVPVKKGNLAAAFRSLSQRLRQNNVMRDFKYQLRHEKKGVKRRRLQGERWRRNFANVVRQKVQLVHAIRRRGA